MVHHMAQSLRARNPATGAILGSVQTTAPEQVEHVVDAARKVQPLWALLRVEDRARYMRRVAQAIIDEFDELARLIGREQGRPRAEVASTELLAAIDALIWIAEDGARVLGARRVGIHRSMSLSQRARVAYEPFGVVGVIGAGSAPFAQPLAQIAGALLAGNGVVFKPARRACLTGERIMGVLARATLPEGLVRLVHGGTQVGVALARAPVDKVLFTGSPAVGRAVARACVSQEKEVTVELGGKDAMVVLADAHVARAASGALWAGCAGAGQARGSVERVYVEREVSERLLTHLVNGARAMRVGDPERAGVQMGPLASARRLQHVRELVEEAVAQGARLHCGGPLPGTARGVRRGGRVLRAGGAERGDTRHARDARAARRAGAGGDRRRLDRPRGGARQRLRVRNGRLDLDRRPPPGAAHRARAAHGDGVAQRPPPRADDRARPVGRGGRRRPRTHARRGGPARLCPGEADRVEPLRRARAVVATPRRPARARRAHGRTAALGPRRRPRARLAPGAGAAGAGGCPRVRTGSGAGLELCSGRRMRRERCRTCD